MTTFASLAPCDGGNTISRVGLMRLFAIRRNFDRCKIMLIKWPLNHKPMAVVEQAFGDECFSRHLLDTNPSQRVKALKSLALPSGIEPLSPP